MANVYYPYFRGKQFELISIRENAKLMADAGIVPIIEPVKESLNGLDRALSAVLEASGQAIVIVNPYYGYYKDNPNKILEYINESKCYENCVTPAILIKDANETKYFHDMLDQLDGYDSISIIHAGYPDASEMSEFLNNYDKKFIHIFIENHCGKLYRKHFKGSKRVLIRDGFINRTNREHPLREHFSDLHVTYADEGMSGFGDFLIVGDDYAETGGPAYTVAIHLTYIDDNQDNEMFVCHFISESNQDKPVDIAGKCIEALGKLVKYVNKKEYPITNSDAVKSFIKFHEAKHHPGLGYVKKLSMKHHLEVLAEYLRSKQ